MSTLTFAVAAALAATGPVDWAVFDPPAGRGQAFSVTEWGCADGIRAVFISSLPNGETRTGVLASPPFDAPATLSFWLAGHSHQQANELRLVDAATGEVLHRQPAPGANLAQEYAWRLAEDEGRRVRLELVDGDTGSGFAWIALTRIAPEVAPFPVEETVGIPEGWTERQPESAAGRTDGIPWRHRTTALPEGGELRWALPGVRARDVFVFTGSNTPDEANPGWGGGDPYRNLFIGDRAGDLVLTYASGREDVVPLVFGYTMWWRGPYAYAPAPFNTDTDAQALLDAALCVANGAKAYDQPDRPFYLCIALRDEPLTAVTLRDNPDKLGHAALDGVTFRGNVTWDGEDEVAAAEGGTLPSSTTAWLADHTLASGDAWPSHRREAVEALGRRLSTFESDITRAAVAAVDPGYDLANWEGPAVSFHGPPEADILTHTFHDSALELLDRIEPDGMVHESGDGAANYSLAFGTWRPGLGAFHGKAYTRNRSMALLSLMGFQDRANDVIDFFNRWVMYFPESYPELQIGGDPVPGHSTVVANQPHLYFDELRHVGWPTRYTTRDFGNPENDGHGFLMLGHWRAWHKAGRDAQWVRARWRAIEEAGDYIPWCLENPELSFSEHGLLYSESEAGMNAVTLFCNVPCYYGLLAYADMAEAIGETGKAARWRETAAGMRAAMDAYFVTEDGLWDTAKAGGWGYEQGVMAPILFGAEFHGWRATAEMAPEWVDRTRRSYEAIRANMRPRWCAPAGFGYGQGYFTEAALLFDRMDEADALLRWMARLCFAPRLPHPFRVPEGSTVGEDGRLWRRWGDLGNLYQMNEATYTVQVMIGIDDTDPGTLRVLPRLPVPWGGMEVAGYPARVASGGASELAHLRLDVRHDPDAGACTLSLATDRPVDRAEVRLGPFPQEADDVRVTRDGDPVDARIEMSGDSAWAWVGLQRLREETTWVARYEMNEAHDR